MISLSIDGKEVSVNEGSTVLEAAKSAGVHIPTLCYHPELRANSACRLCTVEVAQGGRTRLTASCALPAEAGMEVQTASERVLEGRRVLMELLVARCSDVESIKKLAAELGAKTDRLEPRNDKCILCGLCVAVCSQVLGARVIGFSGRGESRKVDRPFDSDGSQCLACGACVYLCPTGAMEMENTTLERDKKNEADRHCRFMRMGLIPYAICPASYECSTCEVDQRFEETTGDHPAFVARPAKLTEPVQVGGYAVMPARYYHSNHVWVEKVGTHLRLGMDDFTGQLAGAIEDLKLLKEAGAELKVGDDLWQLVLKGGKTVTMSCPVSGTLVTINEDIGVDPDLPRKAPYSRGWICIVRPAQPEAEAEAEVEAELAAMKFKDPAVPAYLRDQVDEVNQWVNDEVQKLGGSLRDKGSEVFVDGQVRADLAELLSDAEWQSMTQTFFGTQQ